MIAEQTNYNRTLQSATNAARDELIYRGVTLGEDRQFGQAIELLNRVEQYDNASDEQQYRLAEIYNMRSDWRSEEHTSELQSRGQLVCRLLLEKKHRAARSR